MSAVEIVTANTSEDGRNRNSSKADGPSDNMMDLLHVRYGLCPMELQMNNVFLLSGIVNLSLFARIHDAEGAHWQVVMVRHMKTRRQRQRPCPHLHPQAAAV